MKAARKITLLTLFLLLACGSSDPLNKLKQSYEHYPEYSILLEDMKEEGIFSKEYYHRYKIVYGEISSETDSLVYRSELTDWIKVPKETFRKFSPYLGMVILSKMADGEIVDTPQPPGYQYIGDSRYGRWRQDSSGNSFWEWYGKYALMSHLFGMFNRPVYYNDWNTYSSYRSRGRPYFGRTTTGGPLYGTNGTVTKKTRPDFFKRQSMKAAASRSTFTNKVKNRVRRSNMSRTRSRSRSFGK